jgi:hypothetical protein
MTVKSDRLLPARTDDDLLVDRPAPQALRSARPDVRYQDHPEPRPIVVTAPARPPSPMDVVSRGIGLVIKLTVLLILLAFLWGVVTLTNAGVRAPAALTDQIGSAVERSANAIGAVGQRVADAFDPAHPPRQALAQDVEIDELIRVNVGGQLAGSKSRDLTLTSIQRRADPAGPDSAVYAILRGELREAQETKVLGVTVRSTRDPQEYYLYKGETIRIGSKLYKVNWVSTERQQLALIAYREQDRVTAPLKAEID